MDNVRLILWATFGLAMWFTYRAWVLQYPPVAPVETTPAGQTAEEPATGGEIDLPQLDQASPQLPLPVSQTSGPGRPIQIRTDVFDAIIDGQGGDLVRVDLLEYPVDKNAEPLVPTRLLDFAGDDRWVYQTGLRSTTGGDEPNHLAAFSADRAEYQLSESGDELTVTLDWQAAGPLRASKVYTFRRGQYAVDLDLLVENGGDTAWNGAAYAQLLRRHNPVGRSFTSVDSYSFTGPVLYDGDQFDKLDVDDLLTAPITQSLAGGWHASIQHHFLAAAVPPPPEEIHYQASARGADYVLSAVTNVVEVAPGESRDFHFTLFVGPKLQDQLAAAGPRLELTVDYGIFTFLALPLFWVLDKIFGFVGNWGWSIVITTLLIKLAFYKLTETSGRSMAKMRKLQPRMKVLQETYKDNREQLSRHMMELYKREKVNPAAGCLPILIQMPFFFAFYWVLIESVELRQAPFMLWISDLSARDPYFILPLLMGAAMLVQTRLNPAPPDPVQARVMQIMPIAFTAFFAFFPAGLVLYWLTNTGLSILQQWRINRVIAAD